MKAVKTGLVIIFMLFLSVGLSYAKIYRWVDDNGIVHFTDYPPERGIETTTMKMPSSQTAMDAQENNEQANSGELDNNREKFRNVRDAYKGASVEIFVTNWCKYCKKAKQYLRSQGISFREYNIERDRSAARRKNQLSPHSGVPLAVINGRLVEGFSKEKYERALRN